jgi:hypothetical protein
MIVPTAFWHPVLSLRDIAGHTASSCIASPHAGSKECINMEDKNSLIFNAIQRLLKLVLNYESPETSIW